MAKAEKKVTDKNKGAVEKLTRHYVEAMHKLGFHPMLIISGMSDGKGTMTMLDGHASEIGKALNALVSEHPSLMFAMTECAIDDLIGTMGKGEKKEEEKPKAKKKAPAKKAKK